MSSTITAVAAQRVAVCLFASTLFGSIAAAAEPDSQSAIEISHSEARSAAAGAPSLFVGHAQVEQLLVPHAPSRVSIGTVTFAPGARSNWHTHPVGQTLIVTAGLGWVQQWGQPIQEIRPGDVVWIPRGIKHWHGASAATGMTHLAIQETVADRNVDWLEPVGDDQYRRPSTGEAPSP